MSVNGGPSTGLRVLMISDHADPLAEVGGGGVGGQHVYVMNMGLALAQSGVHVDVYTRWDSAAKKEVVRVHPNLRVIRVEAGIRAYVPRDDFIGLIDEFVAGVRKNIERDQLRYDVLFTHYWYSGIIGMEVARAYRLPISHVFHSIGRARREALAIEDPTGVNDRFFAVRDQWEKRIAHDTTGIIATSPMERDDIVNLFGAPPGKFSVVPHGVDVELFKPRSKNVVREELGLPTDARLVLYVGRLERRKGVSTLLEAIRDLNDGPRPVDLCVIGDGLAPSAMRSDDEAARLRRISDELGIADRVHFLGARSQAETARYFAAGDVCAVPSYYEPFGLVPVEAMACGTPVVASRTGGMRHTVDDGVTGHLVQPRSVADLSAKLRAVLDNGREFYAQAARDRVLRHFRWSMTVRETKRHLSDLVRSEHSKMLT